MYSPDFFSPKMYSPETYSRGMYSPDFFSPKLYSPEIYSPEMYSPEKNSPESAFYRVIFYRVIFTGNTILQGHFHLKVLGTNCMVKVPNLERNFETLISLDCEELLTKFQSLKSSTEKWLSH